MNSINEHLRTMNNNPTPPYIPDPIDLRNPPHQMYNILINRNEYENKYEDFQMNEHELNKLNNDIEYEIKNDEYEHEHEHQHEYEIQTYSKHQTQTRERQLT